MSDRGRTGGGKREGMDRSSRSRGCHNGPRSLSGGNGGLGHPYRRGFLRPFTGSETLSEPRRAWGLPAKGAGCRLSGEASGERGCTMAYLPSVAISDAATCATRIGWTTSTCTLHWGEVRVGIAMSRGPPGPRKTPVDPFMGPFAGLQGSLPQISGELRCALRHQGSSPRPPRLPAGSP